MERQRKFRDHARAADLKKTLQHVSDENANNSELNRQTYGWTDRWTDGQTDGSLLGRATSLQLPCRLEEESVNSLASRPC